MKKQTLRRRLGAWTRPARHTALLAAAETLRRLVCLLPISWIEPVGRLFGRAGWLVAFGQRRIAERQLIEAGVAGDGAQARRIGRRVFENLAMNAVEWLHSTRWSPARFMERVELDPMDLRRIRAEGRGAIVAMGHIGNWEIQMRATHYYLDLPMYAVMAPQRGQKINDWLVRQRQVGGDVMLSSQAGALPIIRVLRKNNIVGMLGDQDSTRVRGIFVDFFGRPASTPAGIGMLAHLSGAPIVPACGWRVRSNHHRVVFGEPLRPDPSLDPETDARRLTQAYTAWLEARIRERPEHWVWMHRRWKRKQEMQDER